MCYNLRVGLRSECYALFLQAFSQIDVVFDDAVVSDCYLSVVTQVRVCVDVVNCAVGSPSGVSYADVGAGELSVE